MIFQQSQLDLRSNPNLLINGDFQTWQRGTTTTNGFGADRWRTYVTANTMTQSAPLDGMSVFNATSYANAGGQLVQLGQAVENGAYSLIKGDMTLSFRIGTGTGFDTSTTEPITAMQVSVWVSNDSAGTTAQQVLGETFTVTPNEWNEFSFNIPQFTPNSLGDTPHLLISVHSENAQSTVFAGFSLSNVKLEMGSVATPFIPDDPATNLAKCQRYYWKPADVTGSTAEMYGSTYDGDIARRQFIINYPQTMRVSPTVTATFTGGTPISLTSNNTDWSLILVDGVGVNASCYLNTGSLSADAEL